MRTAYSSKRHSLIAGFFIRTMSFMTMAISLPCQSVSAQEQIEEVVVEIEQSDNEVLDDLVSATVIDGEKLADAGIENVEDVAAYVPNLVLTQSVTGTNIFIRGIGAGVNQGFDQSVGLYSDGVPLPRANMARSPFLDLAGVQVLRGPQYVLDGNYSIAGSVHMLSNLSTDEFKAGFDFNYTPSQNDRSILLTAGGPISDRFAMNVVVQSKQADGYIRNVFKGEDEAGQDELTTRLVLGFNPTDDLSFKLKAERGTFDTTGRPIEVIFSDPADDLGVVAKGLFDIEYLRQAGQHCGFTGGVPNSLPCNTTSTDLRATPWITEADYRLAPRSFVYQTSKIDSGTPTGEFLFAGNEYFSQWAELYTENGADVPLGLLDTEINFQRASDHIEFSKNESTNYTLASELLINDSSLTSTSSYIEYNFDESIDGDVTPLPLIVIDQNEEYDQIYQAFKFESPRDAFMEFTAGYSYLKSNLTFRDNINLGLDSRDIPPGGSLDDFRESSPLGNYFSQFAPDVTQSFADFGVIRNFKQRAAIQAAFVQSTFNWSDVFRSTLGVRYTHSNKRAFKELYLTDKDFVDFDVIIDPNETERGGRIIDPSIVSPSDLTGATTRFVEFFGLQIHTDRYGDPGIGLDQEALNEQRREEKFLPSFTLEWDVTQDLTLIASVRKANKLGGFDARSNTRPDVPNGRGAPVGTFEFRDELATVYELGTKWFFPRGNGQLSATAFYSEFTNLQTSRSDGRVGANVTNAGAAETRGVEVDGFLALSERFNIQYSMAWIDFEFTDFITGTCHLNERPDNLVVVIDAGGFAAGGVSSGSVNPIAYEEVIREQFSATTIQGKIELSTPLPDRLLEFDALPFGSPVFCDYKGKSNQFVAEWQGTFSFNYRAELSRGVLLKPTLDVLYNSGYATDVAQDPDIAQEEYTQFNARLELADPEDRWTLALTGENLTDEKIVGSAAPTPIANGVAFQRSYFGFIRPPRSFGLNVRYYFY